MAFKRSAVRSRLSPPTTDRKANALRSCSIYGSDTPPHFPQQLNQVHNWRPFSIRRWTLFYTALEISIGIKDILPDNKRKRGSNYGKSEHREEKHHADPDDH